MVDFPTETSGFAGAETAWLERVGALRDVVRQELVARQLAAHLPAAAPLRVLDAGCGQGTQLLRLAAAGHTVTGVDESARMVAELRARLEHEDSEVRDRTTVLRGDAREIAALLRQAEFDVVLCHGVLMYHADDGPLLEALSGVLVPGGVLSLLVRNAAALAMRPGLQGDWAAAGAAFNAGTYRNRLGVTARAHRVGELEWAVRARGLVPLGWYGVRVFTDTAADGAPLPPDLEDVLDVEERAGRTDPYRAVAALTHLLAVRP